MSLDLALIRGEPHGVNEDSSPSIIELREDDLGWQLLVNGEPLPCDPMEQQYRWVTLSPETRRALAGGTFAGAPPRMPCLRWYENFLGGKVPAEVNVDWAPPTGTVVRASLDLDMPDMSEWEKPYSPNALLRRVELFYTQRKLQGMLFQTYDMDGPRYVIHLPFEPGDRYIEVMEREMKFLEEAVARADQELTSQT